MNYPLDKMLEKHPGRSLLGLFTCHIKNKHLQRFYWEFPCLCKYMSRLEWHGVICYKCSIKKYGLSWVEEVRQEQAKMNKGKGERRYVLLFVKKKNLTTAKEIKNEICNKAFCPIL